MSTQQHTSDPAILDRRTLACDHRVLAALLRPGMSVLDVGCGTGAITAGIAGAVAPGGRVVGLDRDPALVGRARAAHGRLAGLSFVEGDVLATDCGGSFDIVTAARVLQWTDRPGDAVRRMRAATNPGGFVVLLDYLHAAIEWTPAPPAAWRRAFDAWLGWRAAHGWDNAMGEHLAAHCAAAGLREVVVTNEDEVARRGEAEFATALDIWRRVIGGLGPQLVAEGHLTDDVLRDGLAAYAAWCGEATSQRMVLRAAVACA